MGLMSSLPLLNRFDKLYPDVQCALVFSFNLLNGSVMSAPTHFFHSFSTFEPLIYCRKICVNFPTIWWLKQKHILYFHCERCEQLSRAVESCCLQLGSFHLITSSDAISFWPWLCICLSFNRIQKKVSHRTHHRQKATN